MSTLAGRVALVTGGARGQGRAHAVALGKAGADVIVADLADQIATIDYAMSTPDDLAETVRLVEDAGGRAKAERVDVRDYDQMDDLVDRIGRDFGRLDVLIANAGVCAFEPVESMSPEQWSDVVNTNLTGTFNSVRTALPLMQRNGFGRIVGVSSGAGRGGMQDLSHYSASKWGIIGFLKSVALEVGKSGITANVVCPTSVATPMVMNPATLHRFLPDLDDPQPADAVDLFASWGPLGVPWLEPEDVTRAVMYLVEDPGLTTGTVIEVNLGTTATRA